MTSHKPGSLSLKELPGMTHTLVLIPGRWILDPGLLYRIQELITLAAKDKKQEWLPENFS